MIKDNLVIDKLEINNLEIDNLAMDNLVIDNLSSGYGDVEILKKINMTLKPGEVNILIGLNGAGKTTLLKTISGLINPYKGKVNYGNKDLIRCSEKERGRLISFIPQYISTKQNYSVKDIIVMGITPYLGIFDMPSKEHYKQVNEILKELNIFHLRDKTIGELSGGERRLVYLGRVIMQQSKILLLDEPNTFLDYVRQHDFFNFITRFIKEKNMVALFTLHDINLALRYGDKIHILNNNSIVEVIEVKKHGYENKLIKILSEIYNKDFEVVETNKGPMIVC